MKDIPIGPYLLTAALYLVIGMCVGCIVQSHDDKDEIQKAEIRGQLDGINSVQGRPHGMPLPSNPGQVVEVDTFGRFSDPEGNYHVVEGSNYFIKLVEK
jgi:hypothetical protein